MIQVIYVRYMKVYVKEFRGETESEDALSFIDHLQNEFFDGGGLRMGTFTSRGIFSTEYLWPNLVGRGTSC